jgi:sigma-B regulation protein RsbU (phosphoserine phosphatase)
MVGDVSGKGVPAALYMARAVSLFRLFAKVNATTREAVTKLNDSLSDDSTANLFVTLAYLIFDSKENMMRFSSGGHNPTLVLKSGEDKCRMLEAKEGMPIGLMPGDFSQEETGLSKGDIIALYSDGVTEAMSKRREEFGEERLTSVIIENRDSDAKTIMQAVKDAVFEFAMGAPQHDDITIIVIKVL